MTLRLLIDESVNGSVAREHDDLSVVAAGLSGRLESDLARSGAEMGRIIRDPVIRRRAL